jgi:hypothetical protein
LIDGVVGGGTNVSITMFGRGMNIKFLKIGLEGEAEVEVEVVDRLAITWVGEGEE